MTWEFLELSCLASLMITCFVIALPILFFQAGGFDGMSASFTNVNRER